MMKYQLTILSATSILGCGSQTDVAAYASSQLDGKPDSGLDAGSNGHDSGAPSPIACTTATDVLIWIYKSDGGFALFNTSNHTFKYGGSGHCKLQGATAMAVQDDDTVWLADGAGRLWVQKSNGLDCTAAALTFAPPVLLTFTTLPGKPWEALYALAGDHTLVGIDPETLVHSTIGQFSPYDAPPYITPSIGLSANGDSTLHTLHNLPPGGGVAVYNYDGSGHFQSKLGFNLTADFSGNGIVPIPGGDTAVGFASAGADLYVFGQQTIYQFNIPGERMVATFPIPADVVAPGIVTVASSPCLSSSTAHQ